MNKTDLKHYADFLENLTVILQKEYWDKKAEYFAAPKGILHIKKRTARKAEYYIYTCENGVKHEKYVPVSQRADILNLMWRKNILRDEINQAVTELLPILESCGTFIDKTIAMMQQLPIKKDFLVSVSEKRNHLQSLRYTTAHGETVRSKSEVIIANLLYEKGIYYSYEKALFLDNMPVYPDFTIIHPYTGRLWIWEHLGMMSDNKYKEAWEHKKERYRKAGITEDTNLILTYEEEGTPLDVTGVINIIDNTFTYKRYELLKKAIVAVT